MKQSVRGILSVFTSILLTFSTLLINWTPAYANPGSFFLNPSSGTVKPGQQDWAVPLYINTNGSNVAVAACVLTFPSAKMTYSHSASFDSGLGVFTDFESFVAGEQATGEVLFTGTDTTSGNFEIGPNVTIGLVYFDISPSATGDITLGMDTGDSSCLVSDENSNSVPHAGTGGTFNTSGVTITESSGSTNVVEGGATDTYDVVLDAAPGGDVVIDVTDDSEVNVDKSSLTFTTGNWDTPQTVTVSAEDDSDIEGAHTGSITHAVNGSSDSSYTGLTVTGVTANVTDNDGLVVEFENTTSNANEGDSGTTSPTINVVVSGGDISGGSAESVEVTVSGGTATGSGDDYSFTDPTTVTIPAADYSSPQTIALTGFTVSGDTDIESDETIQFGLQNPSSGIAIGDADGASGTESAHTHTINNDDGLLVEFELTTSNASEGNSGTSTPTLNVTVGGADTTSGSAESIDVSVTGGTAAGSGDDYTFASPVTVTIPTADYTTPQTISVTGFTLNGDTTVEANETVIFGLSNASSGVTIGNADGASGTESTHTFTANNDDSLLAEFDSTAASSDENTGANTPKIRVLGDSDIATTVNVDDAGTGTATIGSDYTFTDPTTVNIPAGSYDGTSGTEVGFSFSVTGDNVFESDETVDLVLNSPSAGMTIGDADSVGGTENTHTYTISNDETLLVEFNNPTASSPEATGGSKPRVNVSGAVLVSPVNVQVQDSGTGTATSGTDYTFSTPKTVTIPAADYTTVMSVAITGLTITDDSLIEPDETIDFAFFSTPTDVSVGDADGAGGTESTHTYTIANDDNLYVEFTNTASSDNEDDGGNLPTVTVGGADISSGSAQSVEVTVTGGTATGSGGDYSFTDPTTVTIPTADYTTPQTIAIPSLSIVADTTNEVNETIIFGLQNTSSGVSVGNADGAGGTESTHTYTITNDDGLTDTDGDGTPDITDTDDDNDGVSDVIEDAAPNSGDANNDSTIDSLQNSVASVVNPVTGQYTTLQVSGGCSVITQFSVQAESSLASQENGIDYPVGLNDFSLSCTSPGQSANVVLFYDQQYDTSNWNYRKFNRNTNTFTDMAGSVTYSSANIGGTAVTTATYSITDGGSLDEDGSANQTVVDPSGPSVGSLAETGTGAYVPTLLGVLIMIGGLGLTVNTRRRRVVYRWSGDR